MNAKGYFLTESIVAISIFIIAVMAFLALLSKSVSANRLISDRFTANYLAMEGIEISKNILDQQIRRQMDGAGVWNNGVNSPSCYTVDRTSSSWNDYVQDCSDANSLVLKYEGASNFYGYSSGVASPFRRVIMIAPICKDNNCAGAGNSQIGVKINSIVSWTGRSGYDGKIDLEAHFFKWRCVDKGC